MTSIGKIQQVKEATATRKDKNCDNDSQIRQFYAGKKILLTGCTGFLGLGIVEKILRTCCEIDKIYLIVRTKGNMTIEERMKEYFQNPVFEVLQKTNPNFMSKVQAIYGDLQKVNLGFSPEDYKLLTENVNIIIHNAADTSFFKRLSSILKTNSLSTKYLLDLAANCTDFTAFVYVSSAYSQSYSRRIEEKFYAPPGDIKLVDDLIRADESLKNGFYIDALRKILGKWVNTYTYSKAIAEGFVEEFARKTSTACAVYRPAIIMSSQKEPVPGLMTNKTGPSGVLLAYAMGLMHTLPIRPDSVIDLVPIDSTVNCLLACVWDLSMHKKSDGPQVYNYGSSDWKPFFEKMYKLTNAERVHEYPLIKMYWYPFMILTKYYYLFVILGVILHIVPAAIYDLCCWLSGKKGRGLEMTLKLAQFNRSLHYFLSNSWTVKVENTQSILYHMNKTDCEEFPFDLGKLDWNQYMLDFYRGIKLYLLKESKDSIPAAKETFQKFKRIHYSVCTCLLILAVFLLFKLSTVLCSAVC